MDRLLVTVLLGVVVGVAAAYGENGHGQWVGKGEEQQHASDATAGSVQGKSDTLSSCGDVDNCFDCFQQQQCVSNPFGGDPICTPCGWCATNKTKLSWSADVKGECVMAPVGLLDFCQVVDPGADRYCPESVCKVGDWGCACKDNVCPAVEKLIGLFTLEGLWIILILVMSFGVCLATLCVWCVCRTGPGRQVVIVEHHYPRGPGGSRRRRRTESGVKQLEYRAPRGPRQELRASRVGGGHVEPVLPKP